jgi:hypothetical protein
MNNDKARSQEKDNNDKETLERLKQRINEFSEEDNKEKKYTKIIQKTFDKNEETKEDETTININLIAIIYKKVDNNYNFEFIIIKNNNEIIFEKFKNDTSIYVYHERNKIISNCNNFNKKFTNKDACNNFLNTIKEKSKNILYTLSYNFNDITYNIQLSIPIIIILTDTKKLIMINYSKVHPADTDSDTNTYTNIDLTLLSIISTQLFTTITKYLKDNFETELGGLCDKYHDNNIFNNIELYNSTKEYRKRNTHVGVAM